MQFRVRSYLRAHLIAYFAGIVTILVFQSFQAFEWESAAPERMQSTSAFSNYLSKSAHLANNIIKENDSREDKQTGPIGQDHAVTGTSKDNLITGAEQFSTCAFAKPSDRDSHCERELKAKLEEMSQGSWDNITWKSANGSIITKPSSQELSRCLSGKTLFFVGDSHMRIIVLNLLENLFLRTQDLWINSRNDSAEKDRSCGGQDGFNIEACGWPLSKRWTMDSNKIVEEIKIHEPQGKYPPKPESHQWRIVFQFKTFISTPQLDAYIVDQLREYSPDILFVQNGNWGIVPYEGKSYVEQARIFFQTLTDGFKGPIVVVYGCKGDCRPETTKPLLDFIPEFPNILVLDRMNMLDQASTIPALGKSLRAHGFQGEIASATAYMLLSYLCPALTVVDTDSPRR